MTSFQWQGRNAQGQLVRGSADADSADGLAAQLARQNITPLDITPGPGHSDSSDWLRQLGFNKVGIDDLILFCRQMYTLTKSGVPLTRGLRGVADVTRHAQLKQAIAEAIVSLESGRELALSLAQNPQVFPTMLISLVRVGETSGNLEGAFQQMANYLEQDRDFRDRLKAAMRYPLMVVVAIVVAVIIMMVWVIPVFANFFNQEGAVLPLPTRIIIGASNFTAAYWWLLLLVGTAGAGGFIAWIKTETGRYRWDRLKLRIPVIGTILTNGVMARFARAFAMTSRSGVPLMQGMALIARAVENAYIGRAIDDMRNGVERGDSLLRSATSTGLFTPLVLQMLAVGEETGEVDSMMLETAQYYEREVDYDLNNLSAYIEPLLLLVMAAMVLVLALGIFLPMWSMGSAALG